MSDVLIVSCRLCLEPDELPSMVTIDRLLSNPPRTVSATICRACAREIASKFASVDSDGTQEVRDDSPDGSHSSRSAAYDPASYSTIGALVSEGERRGETADLDRPEPEVPAGGADGERAPEKG